MGRNGSRGVLIKLMSVSSIVPEKSRRNKKGDEEEEEVERHIFGRFGVTAVIFPHRLMYRCHATVTQYAAGATVTTTRSAFVAFALRLAACSFTRRAVTD